jgi:hypothetical protein
MADVFVPCPGCHRHARVSETICPFCGGSLEGASIVPSASRRLSRASVFAFASTVSALTLVGCGSSDSTATTPPVDAAGDSVADSIGTLYGGPMDTSFLDSASPDSADSAPADTAKDTGPEDGGGVMPAYGLPPSDAK